MAKNREDEQRFMEKLATDIESDNPWDRKFFFSSPFQVVIIRVETTKILDFF